MKLLYEKLIAFFSLMKLSMPPETTQKIVSLIGDIAHALKRLIRESPGVELFVV